VFVKPKLMAFCISARRYCGHANWLVGWLVGWLVRSFILSLDHHACDFSNGTSDLDETWRNMFNDH